MAVPHGDHALSGVDHAALLLLVALIARSVSMSMSVSLLRDAVGMLGVVTLAGGVIAAAVGLWHAASRPDQAARTGGFSVPGWFPDQGDATVLRYWDGTAWTGDTARRETTHLDP